jgi:ketopantoate reductase
MITSDLISELAQVLPPDTAIVLFIPGFTMEEGEEYEEDTVEKIFHGGISPGGGGEVGVDGIVQGVNTP